MDRYPMQVVVKDPNPKKRDKIPCAKYFIYGCNVLLLVIGFCFIALGVWLKTDPRLRAYLSEQYRQQFYLPVGDRPAIISDSVWGASTLYWFDYLIILLGCVMVVVAFFGCCGAILDNQCLIMTYFMTLILVFCYSVGCGAFLLFRRDAVKNEVSLSLTYNVQKYYSPGGIIQEAMDQLQDLFRCCGNSGCIDYVELNMDTPRSCDITCDGCQDRIYRALRIGFTIAGVVLAICCVAEVVSMACSMYLCCTVRKRQERAKAYLYSQPPSQQMQQFNHPTTKPSPKLNQRPQIQQNPVVMNAQPPPARNTNAYVQQQAPAQQQYRSQAAPASPVYHEVQQTPSPYGQQPPQQYATQSSTEMLKQPVVNSSPAYPSGIQYRGKDSASRPQRPPPPYQQDPRMSYQQAQANPVRPFMSYYSK